MSISVMESLDTVRALDAMNSRQERINAAERAVIEDFTEACRRGDANALASFAPMVTDWHLAKLPHPVGDPVPKRAQTLSEVMVESLDYAGGPDMSEAMQLILNAAYGSSDTHLSEMARGLVKRMAQTHAKHSVVAE